MKNIQSLLLIAIVLLVSACDPNVLSRKEAEHIIRKGTRFPHVIEYEIDRSNFYEAGFAVHSNLDEEGYLVVKQTTDFANIGQIELISFTDKAKPYLLPTSDEKLKNHLQRIKLADEDFGEIIAIRSYDDGKSATVEFTTNIINLTPFATMFPRKVDIVTIPNKAEFELKEDGWHWVNKSEFEARNQIRF